MGSQRVRHNWNDLACVHADYSPLDSSVHGILQAKMLEWVDIPFSRGSSWARDQTQVSYITDSLPSEPPGKPWIHLANHEKQISQINDFIVCISMGRCKNLVSLISPWDIYLCKGLCIQSTEYLILIFIQNSSQVTLLVATEKGYDLIFEEWWAMPLCSLFVFPSRFLVEIPLTTTNSPIIKDRLTGERQTEF